MWSKVLTFIFVFAVSSNAQNFDEFIANFKAERNFIDNPCNGRSGAHFARNSRGCSWYFACDSEGAVIREDRCPGDLRQNIKKPF